MHKMLVVASREYQAAVRTKTFIISLLIMPIMMGGSIVLQWLFRDVRDTRDKQFVVIDRIDRPDLLKLLAAGIDKHNKEAIFDSTKTSQVRARLLLERREGKARTAEEVQQERYELSEQVRKGKLVAFLELVRPDETAATGAQVVLRYQSNNPTYREFAQVVELAITKVLRDELAAKSKLDEAQVNSLVHPVQLESKGLSKRGADGQITEASEGSRITSFLVPFVLMMLMFMAVMMTATPLMQGVVEEKMQRIAEVLLGSVPPFELMMGKLIGMTAVSLTIAAVYLGGGYWAAQYFGFADAVSFDLLALFLFFQILAGLMFGSLFIAVGAACTDIKETQNLLLPVMLIVVLPMMMVGNVIQEPNGPLVRGVSFFPFATPMLMVARHGVPPGLPWWEPAVGGVLVLATTVLCVWAAGRIFRIGILLQGKGAKLSEIVKWVFRG